MPRHAISLSGKAVITRLHPSPLEPSKGYFNPYTIHHIPIMSTSQAAEAAKNPSSSHAGTSAETHPRQPIWLRCEKKPFEHRSALTPTTAKILLDNNFDVMVERDPQRIFEDSEFEA